MQQDVYWLDLETSGLDPETCQILEIALVPSTILADGEIQNRQSHGRVFPLSTDPATWDPFVLDMHLKNGLIEECKKSTQSLEEADKFFSSQITGERVTLGGNSVHFDLRFLLRYMPLTAAKFSHRLFDLSAVALFLGGLGYVRTPQEPAHRALDDCNSSILFHGTLRNFVTAKQ